MTGERVIRVRPRRTTTDRYGATVADWSTTTRASLTGCSLSPRGESEDTTGGRQGVIVGYTLYAPAGADIRPTDRIEARGETFEIDGEPGDWRSPYSRRVVGVELALRRVEG